MPNWFYYDESGSRNGPIPTEHLKQLAESGIILPDTIIEADNGQKAYAKNTKGLFTIREPATKKMETPLPPPPLPEPPVSVSPLPAQCYYTNDDKKHVPSSARVLQSVKSESSRIKLASSLMGFANFWQIVSILGFIGVLVVFFIAVVNLGNTAQVPSLFVLALFALLPPAFLIFIAEIGKSIANIEMEIPNLNKRLDKMNEFLQQLQDEKSTSGTNNTNT